MRTWMLALLLSCGIVLASDHQTPGTPGERPAEEVDVSKALIGANYVLLWADYDASKAPALSTLDGKDMDQKLTCYEKNQETGKIEEKFILAHYVGNPPKASKRLELGLTEFDSKEARDSANVAKARAEATGEFAVHLLYKDWAVKDQALHYEWGIGTTGSGSMQTVSIRQVSDPRSRNQGKRVLRIQAKLYDAHKGTKILSQSFCVETD